MKGTDSFRDFVLDQLARVPDVRARPMFGGLGLYAGDVFFGIMATDVLYLKVDDATRPDYEAHGSRAFTPYANRPMTMPYYNVPAVVLEDAPMLSAWARRSIAIAKTTAKARAARS